MNHLAPPSEAAIRLQNCPDLSRPLGHYSHVAVHGEVAYISGQLPLDEAGMSLADQPFEAQARQVLHNIDRCLAAVGSSRARLVSVTVYVTDISQWPAFDVIYAEWIGDHQPARAVAGANDLHYGSAVEVQAIAAVS